MSDELIEEEPIAISAVAVEIVDTSPETFEVQLTLIPDEVLVEAGGIISYGMTDDQVQMLAESGVKYVLTPRGVGTLVQGLSLLKGMLFERLHGG